MNDEILENFFLFNNHSINTQKWYKSTLSQWCKYCGMTLQELLIEAEDEENKGIKLKYSKLKNN